MAASEDILIGRIALQLNLISVDQLAECVTLQGNARKPLGQILIEKNYLTQAQLDKILEVQKANLAVIDPVTKRRKEAVLFGKLAVREEYVDEESVNECLRLQAMPDETRTLGEILVDRGYLTVRQVHDLLGRQIKKIMACVKCRLSFTVLTLTQGKNVTCPKCKGPLEETRRTDTVHTDAEFSTQVMKAVKVPPPPPPPKPAKIVKTTCVICDTAFEGAIDSTGRMTCPACRSSFTPR